ncbi:porphobilinogen deaminase [Spinactinospora alkalitolerans]|uniref:hydroxymethylbilane synthase n=1 Tax=Spinactinospora alkalitolerans TaxID=687207 RepID=A0A852TYB7_9ACTN|nr:porphobilinogen deaminase [Spinactinospora alkalitolerans]
MRDVAVFREDSPYRSLDEVPPGTSSGTGAVRRRAQLLKYRPDLHVDRIRGNVNSRLARLDSAVWSEGCASAIRSAADMCSWQAGSASTARKASSLFHCA